MGSGEPHGAGDVRVGRSAAVRGGAAAGTLRRRAHRVAGAGGAVCHRAVACRTVRVLLLTLPIRPEHASRCSAEGDSRPQ